MKNNKKDSFMVALVTSFMVGLVTFIARLIFNLILERDLLEGQVISITWMVIAPIPWMVKILIRNRKKVKRKMKWKLFKNSYPYICGDCGYHLWEYRDVCEECATEGSVRSIKKADYKIRKYDLGGKIKNL